jgi:S1-C subfamily serine protease
MQTQIAELAEELDRVGARCLRGADEGSSVVAGTEPPRRITVLVRPTWEDQEGKSQDTGSFGSGVLVRWRLPSGETEVRVVSNAHVLGGAQNADIIAADELDNKPKNGKVDKTWRAHVLRISEDDDLAVLRLDDDASAPESGVTLRFSPPDEQETVVAAGFPGVGSRPSFQISQGTISNRKFAINEGAFGVYLQHTSPIDPGNSGGPLLDSDGRLLGLNTIKIRGRDNVGLAIPTARVLLALERADDARTFLPEHAAALCQSLLGELASDAPTGAIVDHMSLSLTAPGSQMVDRSVTAVRAAVRTEGAGPDWQARLTAFARLRARIDAEGGVPKLSVCSEPTKRADKGSFELTFASATETHKLQLANEGGVLRLVWVD